MSGTTLRLRLALMGLTFALSGCVTGVERRAPSHEAARETPPPPPDEPGAGQVVAGSPKARPDPVPVAQDSPGPEWVWVRGYWHWDGVRYEWRRGHWERARPGWVRPAPP